MGVISSFLFLQNIELCCVQGGSDQLRKFCFQILRPLNFLLGDLQQAQGLLLQTQDSEFSNSQPIQAQNEME